MEIIGITISEGNQGHVIAYTKLGKEIEYGKKYLRMKLGIKKYNNLLRS